ncbi:hypothetical protein ACJMK2_032437 [Sinanodonta woodiana]|uniref:Ig-like domain-containing protein n=1 Tax=Sinanodonta woodiana TaxID=1069815 RepID=A0ABD3X1R4_SINWO
MFFTSLLLFFTCTWMISECTAEDVYALANKEGKLYFDYSQDWNKTIIKKGGDILASIEKTSTNMTIKSAGKEGIGVKYIDTQNQVMVTIRKVSSNNAGSIIMYDARSGRLLKQWNVHVLERPLANPIIRESSPPWAGEDYQLNCSGDSFGVKESKWYNGGHQLKPDAKYSVTGTKLTIRNIQREDRPKLTCVAVINDDIQSNTSDILSVDVLYGPNIIKITSEPPDFAIEDGKSITLKCDATCHPPCHFQWSGLIYAIGSSLEVQYTTSNQNGPYSCTATNPKSATKIKGETVYLNSGKQVTETFVMTESSRGVPIYVVIPMAIVILVMVGYVIWIHQKRLTSLETDRPHSRQECNHEFYITAAGAEINLPLLPMNDGHASDSTTEQGYSPMSILHTNQNMCFDKYEKVDAASTDAGERVCNSYETVYEPLETISKAVDDKL